MTKSYKLKTSIDHRPLVGAPLRSGTMEATGVAPAEELSLKQHQPT